MDPLKAAPLSAAQGLWQMQVFFGQVLPHECENDVNKTGNIISKYIERMRFVKVTVMLVTPLCWGLKVGDDLWMLMT